MPWSPKSVKLADLISTDGLIPPGCEGGGIIQYQTVYR
jgi:hypothetical protein